MERRINEWLDEFCDLVMKIPACDKSVDEFIALCHGRNYMVFPPENDVCLGEEDHRGLVNGWWAEVVGRFSKLEAKLDHFQVTGDVIVATISAKHIGIHGDQKTSIWWNTVFKDVGGKLKALSFAWASKIPPADEREIVKNFAKLNELWNSRPTDHLDEALDVFSADCVMMPPDHTTLHGHSEIKEFLHGQFTMDYGNATRFELYIKCIEKMGDSYFVIYWIPVTVGDKVTVIGE